MCIYPHDYWEEGQDVIGKKGLRAIISGWMRYLWHEKNSLFSCCGDYGCGLLSEAAGRELYACERC